MIVGQQIGEGDIAAEAGVAEEGHPTTFPDLKKMHYEEENTVCTLLKVVMQFFTSG